MSKKMTKAIAEGNKRDDTAAIVAKMCGVTPRYVRMVKNGERENQQILSAYIELKEGKNQLIEEVKKLVPFN